MKGGIRRLAFGGIALAMLMALSGSATNAQATTGGRLP